MIDFKIVESKINELIRLFVCDEKLKLDETLLQRVNDAVPEYRSISGWGSIECFERVYTLIYKLGNAFSKVEKRISDRFIAEKRNFCKINGHLFHTNYQEIVKAKARIPNNDLYNVFRSEECEFCGCIRKTQTLETDADAKTKLVGNSKYIHFLRLKQRKFMEDMKNDNEYIIMKEIMKFIYIRLESVMQVFKDFCASEDTFVLALRKRDELELKARKEMERDYPNAKLMSLFFTPPAQVVGDNIFNYLKE